MSISISNLVYRKKQKNPADEVYENVSLDALAKHHTKHSYPADTQSPVNFGGANVKMSKFGHDDAHLVSSAILYLRMYPETNDYHKATTHPYAVTENTSDDAQVQVKVRGFNNSDAGLATATMAGQSVTGITATTAKTFSSMGGTSNNSIGERETLKVTYYNAAGTAVAASSNTIQIGLAGGGGSTATRGGSNAYEKNPFNITSFTQGNGLVFIDGAKCSSFRWGDSTTPTKASWSKWMYAHGEYSYVGTGTTAKKIPNADYSGSSRRHGTIVT